MDWVTGLIIAGAIAAFLLWKRLGVVAEADACLYLKQGAKVVDVRSVEEFKSGHLPGAVNVPLGELTQNIVRVAPDKEQVLLLHCLSGGRSGLGVRALKGAGYRRVFNLGGYGRAERILKTARA